LGYVPADGVALKLSTLAANLATNTTELNIFPLNATFRSTVSQSDLIFSGLNAKVLQAADIVIGSSGQITIKGFSNLTTDATTDLEIWVRPSAFASVNGTPSIAYTASILNRIVSGSLEAVALGGGINTDGGATIATATALTVTVPVGAAPNIMNLTFIILSLMGVISLSVLRRFYYLIRIYVRLTYLMIWMSRLRSSKSFVKRIRNIILE
jgi:hypothetical protein